MAYAQPGAWYAHSGDGATTGYYAIPVFAASAAYVAGQLVRPLTPPAVGNERVYVCIVAGTAATEPVWTFTKGAIQPVTGAVTFQECSGEPGLNGDISVNCPIWATASTPLLGRVIYDTPTSTLHICTVSAAGFSGVKPTFQSTTGAQTTTDGSARWICLGLASTWTAWKAPAPRLTVVTTANWGTAGNDFYVADNSAEVSTAAITLNIGTTTVAPSRYFSVDHTATTMPPAASALKAGASITGSLAAAAAIGVASTSNVGQYWFGFAFIVNGNAAAALLTIVGGANVKLRFEQCSFVNNSANAGALVSIGGTAGAGATADFVNCTFGFGNAGHTVTIAGGSHTFRSPSLAFFSGTMPATAFKSGAGGAASILMESIDFSALGANALFLNNNIGGFWTLKNCRLHASTILYTPPLSNAPVFNVDLINTDSGTSATRNERHNWYGDETTLTTVYRTGGATENAVGISHLIVPVSANARPHFPFAALPLVIWNDLIGSPRTLTVYGCCDVLTTIPTNIAIWIDVEYMSSAATPIGSIVSTGPVTVLDAGTAYSADTSTWTGSIQSGSRFAMSVTFTPQIKGNVYVYPRAAGSVRVILDPLPVIT